MTEITANVNWLAVVIGAVIAFIAGWLWYSPMLFGKQWAAGNGVSLGSAENMPMTAMGAQAIGLLALSWFVGVTAAGNMLWTLILAVIAFGLMQASGALFINKPLKVVLIDFGYLIVVAIIMFIVQAIL